MRIEETSERCERVAQFILRVVVMPFFQQWLRRSLVFHLRPSVFTRPFICQILEKPSTTLEFLIGGNLQLEKRFRVKFAREAGGVIKVGEMLPSEVCKGGVGGVIPGGETLPSEVCKGGRRCEKRGRNASGWNLQARREV